MSGLRPSALKAAAVAVGLLAAGCSGSSHHSSPVETTTPSPIASPTTSLKSASHAQHATSAIQVGDSWEGATWAAPKAGTVTFWKYSGGQWSAIGHSRYPVYGGLSCTPQIAGAVVSGATDPTYIVGGCFSGDGVVNTAAFANGPHGWGLVLRSGTTLVASGKPGTRRNGPASALFYRAKIDKGVLVTVLENNNFFDNADGWRYPLRSKWQWSGSAYQSTSTDAFVASKVAPPKATNGKLHRGACPSSGSFKVSVGLGDNALRGPHAEQAIRVLLYPPSDIYPKRKVKCAARLGASPIQVQVAHTSSDKLFLSHGTITHRMWVTAPPWLLLRGNGLSPTPFFPGSATAGESPYVVPASLGVNEVTSYFHQPNQHKYLKHLGTLPRPDHGIATFKNGKLETLSITTLHNLHPAHDARENRRLHRHLHH